MLKNEVFCLRVIAFLILILVCSCSSAFKAKKEYDYAKFEINSFNEYLKSIRTTSGLKEDDLNKDIQGLKTNINQIKSLLVTSYKINKTDFPKLFKDGNLIAEINENLLKNLEMILRLNAEVKLPSEKEYEPETEKMGFYLPNKNVFISSHDLISMIGLRKVSEEKQKELSLIKMDKEDGEYVSRDKIKENEKSKLKKIKKRRRMKFFERKSKTKTKVKQDISFLVDLPPVQNQPCGNCWAVSAATILTALINFKNRPNRMVGIFSIQQFMDCVHRQNEAFFNLNMRLRNSNGCLSGCTYDAARYINAVIAAPVPVKYFKTSANYGYQGGVAVDGNNHITTANCQANIVVNGIGDLSNTDPNLVGVQANSNTQPTNSSMYNTLSQNGPMTVDIFISTNRQDRYAGNLHFGVDIIYTNRICQDTPNTFQIVHTVTLYGYRTLLTHPCWIVRNSWGNQDRDLLYSARGTANTCFIRSYTTWLSG